jgi:hypothetical protein
LLGDGSEDSTLELEESFEIFGLEGALTHGKASWW